ncbi:glycosyltransferase [Halocatena pleomorpha]|uniref:Glycosyltransferase n=1 Tax=Halocatena pleomorpha TaxID=1785090 RepID=A0A3P3RPB3_9EURY|nr:glycosyltransferase [Halocatena pleomorpha]RRJ34213.1 glycosyltransferase [Halocatena pleomorpha]
MKDDATTPTVSFVIPTYNERTTLPATLRSIDALTTTIPYEVLVVDGGSTDATRAVAQKHGVTVYHCDGTDVGPSRHIGATHAAGEWLAFIDADTTVSPTYLDTMLEFVTAASVEGATSRCRVVGCRRAKIAEWTVNHLFPRLSKPILPGFNCFVATAAYFAVGGFSDVPNEDVGFSHRLSEDYRTAACPTVLVETSARRIESLGLTRTLMYYSIREWQRKISLSS